MLSNALQLQNRERYTSIDTYLKTASVKCFFCITAEPHFDKEIYNYLRLPICSFLQLVYYPPRPYKQQHARQHTKLPVLKKATESKKPFLHPTPPFSIV
jgi:hypothetical protein